MSNGKAVVATLMRQGDNYQIKVSNMAQFRPGDPISAIEAKSLSDNSQNQITFVDNDILQAVIGGIIGRMI